MGSYGERREWQKSSFSFNTGECVELAFLDAETVLMRDSKDPGGPKLQFSRSEFNAFVRGVLDGEFDRYR